MTFHKTRDLVNLLRASEVGMKIFSSIFWVLNETVIELLYVLGGILEDLLLLNKKKQKFPCRTKTGKGPFTKDVRGEGGRGVAKIRTNPDIGRGVLFSNLDVRV